MSVHQLPDSPLAGWGTPSEDVARLPLNFSSIAKTNKAIAKTGPGYFYGFTVINTNTSDQYIQVFDATSLPADGTVPACVFVVSGSKHLSVQWVPWRTFGVGLVLCNSTTADTKTIGAADCLFDVQFV